MGEVKAIWRKREREEGRGPQKHATRERKNKAGRGKYTIEYSSGPEKSLLRAEPDLFKSGLCNRRRGAGERREKRSESKVRRNEME